MYSDDLLSSRTFSTEVGVRPAEPCSVSVVATHQLLTNIFGHICVTVISDPHFSRAAGSIIRERDLQILERCNQDGLKALEDIVGVDCRGRPFHEMRSKTERELRSAGDLWANHILENAKVSTRFSRDHVGDHRKAIHSHAIYYNFSGVYYELPLRCGHSYKRVPSHQCTCKSMWLDRIRKGVLHHQIS